MDWSLPHFPADQRGVRRWFSIASSPSEDKVMISMRFSQPSSTFKKALVGLKPDGAISTVGPQGDFILPKDKDVPLIWIAGGIGITPFRSQAKWLQDNKQKRKITLFYANPAVDQIAFKKLLDKIASSAGMKIVYTVDSAVGFERWRGETGRIDMDMIKKHAPNWQDSLFYISGPKPMVEAFEKMLKNEGVKRQNIKVDYFPGYNVE
jgi:ferredoxin-NADP reductase